MEFIEIYVLINDKYFFTSYEIVLMENLITSQHTILENWFQSLKV